jgi:hypothetical protein
MWPLDSGLRRNDGRGNVVLSSESEIGSLICFCRESAVIYVFFAGMIAGCAGGSAGGGQLY